MVGRMRGKEWSRVKQYITLMIITAITVAIYLILVEANLNELISIDSSKPMDSFIIKLIESKVEVGIGLFAFCEYNIQNLVIYLFSLCAQNVVVGINIYYLLSFFLISAAMFWYLQRQKMSLGVAMYVAILIAFIPYHVERGIGQIITSSFYLVPIFFAIWQDIIYEEKVEKINWGYMLVMCIAPFIDFTLSVMMLILMIVLMIHRNKWGITKSVLMYVLPLVLFVILRSRLSNPFVKCELQECIELAREEGLRLLDLIMPFRYHASDFLWNIRYEYDVTYHAHGECGLNSLGILLCCCFILGLINLFFGEERKNRIAWLSWINIVVILISYVSGINLIFEYFGLHIIYWNRMAIFIIVSAGTILGLLAEQIYGWLENKVGSIVAKCSLGFIGLLGFMEVLLRQNMFE